MPKTGAAPVGLKPATVEEWMVGLGAIAPLDFARAGSGQSNLTYRATDAVGRRWILRRPPTGPLLPSAHDIAREHRILRALEPTSVPTPVVCGFTDDPAITDAPLLLMTFVSGIVVESLKVAQALAPDVRERLGYCARARARARG